MTAPDTPRLAPLGHLGGDRAASERTLPDLLAEARAQEGAKALVLVGDRAPLAAGDRLAWISPDQAPEGGEWAFLGRDDSGAPLLLCAFPGDAEEAVAAAAGWSSLRASGGALTPDDAARFVEALSLGRWLLDAPFCSFCGTRAHILDGGWSRRCPGCGRTHFPRTDPAVIVAVTHPDDSDLLLLGSNAAWARERYSCFAGFVEAGESLESAVVREVEEEAGVRPRSVRYHGSQAWPYPRSLMLGFFAEADDAVAARADGEEIADVRWFSRDEIGAALDRGGEMILPGPASIAHMLITDWFEERE